MSTEPAVESIAEEGGDGAGRDSFSKGTSSPADPHQQHQHQQQPQLSPLLPSPSSLTNSPSQARGRALTRQDTLDKKAAGAVAQGGPRPGRGVVRGPSIVGGNIAAARKPSMMEVKTSQPKVVAPKKKKKREAVGQYLLGDSLGSGQFGRVYRGVNSENGEFVAIKQLKSSLMDESAVVAFESEIALLEKLHHENIVRYFSVIRGQEHINLVIEYCDGGALSDIVKKFGNLNEQLCAVYIKQVLRGLDYLHSQFVVHRDIKGANILLTKTGQVKLADFGISTTANSSNNDMDMMGNSLGSPYWMSPEVIQMEVQPTTKADIWSLGATIIELITGNPPYHKFNAMGAIVRIAQEERPPLPPNVSEKLADLLIKCFQKDVDARPSAADLLEHPWVQSVREGAGIRSINELKATVRTLNEGFSSPSRIRQSQDNIEVDSKTNQATSVRIWGESIRSDVLFKTTFVTSSTVVEEVIQIVLKKYQVPKGDNEFALWEEKDTGEVRRLGDQEPLIPIINAWGETDKYHYKLSLRRKPESQRFRDGYVKVLSANKLLGVTTSQTWQERYLQFDAENRFLVIYTRNDANSKPLLVVYNLAAINAVHEVTNDPQTNTYEFYINVFGRKYSMRAASNVEMTTWVSVIRAACELTAYTNKK